MTVKYLKLLWYRFCPLKPEIARFSIEFRLNIYIAIDVVDMKHNLYMIASYKKNDIHVGYH